MCVFNWKQVSVVRSPVTVNMGVQVSYGKRSLVQPYTPYHQKFSDTPLNNWIQALLGSAP